MVRKRTERDRQTETDRERRKIVREKRENRIPKTVRKLCKYTIYVIKVSEGEEINRINI